LSYYKQFPTPYAMIACVVEDLKLFADLGADNFFCESGDYDDASQHFIAMKFWMAYQLLVDPHQPADRLVKIFTDGYFGPGADRMRAYLQYQRTRINNEAQFKMLRDEPHKLAYLDLAFFLTAQAMFDEAEALVEPGSLDEKHVHVERFTLDAALLYLWPWLNRKLAEGAPMPFDRNAVIERYVRGWKALLRARHSRIYTHNEHSINVDGKLLVRMVGLFRDPQLPAQVRDLPDRDVADFNWLTFSHIRPRQKFVPDDEAAGGMAATFTHMSNIQLAEAGGQATEATAEQQHRKAVQLGVTGGPTLTLTPGQIPRDGKYHLHRIGRVSVQTGTTVWALEGQRLGVNVDRIFEPDANNPAANEWIAYISLKFQGPAYVQGATQPNGVWMDRVLLVKPQNEDTQDDAEVAEERRRAALRPQIEIPHLPAAVDGEHAKVEWDHLQDERQWWTLAGKLTKRDVSVKFAHDGKWLYMRLHETLNPLALTAAPDIWGGDDWELLIAAQRGAKPYRQLAVNPKGKYVELAYGESSWTSGVRLNSQTTQHGWTLTMALPLNQLVSGGVQPGQTVYLNILRGGQENLVWSPTFGDKFHTLGNFGQATLQ
jgi:hypothetical protein